MPTVLSDAAATLGFNSLVVVPSWVVVGATAKGYRRRPAQALTSPWCVGLVTSFRGEANESTIFFFISSDSGFSTGG